jgi:hypothetical protein
MENGKYNKITEILRKSQPDPGSLHEIEDTIISIVRKKEKPSVTLPGLIDFAFSWIYIPWVRRSLFAASFVMLALFLWQQNSIMNQIEYLGKRMDNRFSTYDPSGALEKKLILFKNSNQVMVPQEDLNKLLDSLKSAQHKYRDIMKLIDDDPMLKKAVEDKLRKNIGPKFNL